MIVEAVVLLGAVLILLAAIGVVRFDDVLTRMHALTKASTLGVLLVLVGAALYLSNPNDYTSLALAAGLQLLTSPVSAHLIGRATYRAEGIDRATVNNGGDIALHLLAGQSLRLALVPDLSDPGAVHDAQRRLPLHISSDTTIRGVATSGWPGRSFSLGIADSVTILAATCSEADAAATFVANAVNCEHPSIVRRPATELQPDSDLGERAVTVAVPPLPAEWIDLALDAGALEAEQLIGEGRISGAILVCQRRVRRLGLHCGS